MPMKDWTILACIVAQFSAFCFWSCNVKMRRPSTWQKIKWKNFLFLIILAAGVIMHACFITGGAARQTTQRIAPLAGGLLVKLGLLLCLSSLMAFSFLLDKREERIILKVERLLGVSVAMTAAGVVIFDIAFELQ